MVLVTALSGLIGFGTPVLAQSSGEMTADEIKERFDTQKTRGLTIATPETPTAPASAGVVAPVAVVQQVAIPKDEQVNINISFDFDSASLRDDQKPKLTNLCAALKAADVQMVRILGHTDASGSADYNQRLSKLRAEEVKRFLASDCGFPADRMEAQGAGEQFLYDPNDPKADANRRVEFQALS
ncbi:MAG: outer membrane protein OmpA-like peptidoglycan-associated protein [Celeribacter sp.]|jgi:outer membrane protein OmpA-like peptidoglycan-associated protein